MRKIEQEMLEAIRERKDWQKDNTRVSFFPEGCGDVFLHGHHIATIGFDLSIKENTDTLRDWPTVTTKSRLRALGVDLTQEKGKIYIDGEYVTSV